MLLIIFFILVLCHAFFYLGVKTNKFSVMDIAWGLGFVLIAWVGYLETWDKNLPKTLLLLMVTAWGGRLASYIYLRSKDKGEDPRYDKLKESWGADWLKQGYLKVFMLQGALMFVISFPVQLGMTSLDDRFHSKQLLGFLVWAAGFALEVWSDYHLNKFKMNPANKGKICMDGPWQICRFPNYLGEITLWWGVYIYIFNFWSAWTAIGPALLTYFILKVSGVPMLEEKYNQRSDYREYSAHVPRVWPLTFARIGELITKYRSSSST